MAQKSAANERLENLKQFLAAELKNKPIADQYVADLRNSIAMLEKQVKNNKPYEVVS